MTNPYIRFVCLANQKIWDDTISDLVDSCTYANSVINLVQGNHGGYPITIPAAFPVGIYDMLLYDAVSPSNADQVQLGRPFQWDGTQMTFLE
jgi:hypothetical protein